MTKYAFVYGTLRPSERNYMVIGTGGKPLGQGVLPGAVLYELNGGAFPGLKLTGNPADVVTGDIIEILDEATIQRMDRLEGHPSFYERVKQTVYMSQGLDLECWVYIYKHPVYQEDMIPSGDWKKRN